MKTSFLIRFPESFSEVAAKGVDVHVCLLALARHRNDLVGRSPSTVGSLELDRQVREAARYWRAALSRSPDTHANGEQAEVNAAEFQRYEDPEVRYNLLRSALCKEPPQSGNLCEGYDLLSILDSSSYEKLLNLILPIILLTVEKDEVDVMLSYLMQSRMAAKYFVHIGRISPQVLQEVIAFMLRNLFSKACDERSVQHQRYKSVVMAIARSSTRSALEVLRSLGHRRPNGKPNKLSADLFCRVARDHIDPNDVSSALYEALFPAAERLSLYPVMTSCVLCNPRLARSHWLLSELTADEASYYLTAIAALLRSQLESMCSKASESFYSSDELVSGVDPDLHGVSTSCTVCAVLLICLSPTHVREGRCITHDLIEHIAEALSKLQDIVQEFGIDYDKVFFSILRKVISLLTILALCAGGGNSTAALLLAQAVQRHLDCALRQAERNFNTNDELFYAFYVRSAGALCDGRALCRAALESIFPGGDFSGRVVDSSEGASRIHAHLCCLHEQKGGACCVDSVSDQKGDELTEVKFHLIPSIDACRHVSRLPPFATVNISNLPSEFSQLQWNKSLPVVGDRSWCLELLLLHAPNILQLGVRGSAVVTVASVYTHNSLLAIIKGDDLPVPSIRAAQLISSWYSCRSIWLSYKDAVLTAPLPLMRQELQEFVNAVLDIPLNVNRAFELNVISAKSVQQSVALFSSNKAPFFGERNNDDTSYQSTPDCPRLSDSGLFTFAREIALANDLAKTIVDTYIRGTRSFRGQLLETDVDSCTSFCDNDDKLWRLVFAVYAALVQSCGYRYAEPVTVVETTDDKPHYVHRIVHAMCEGPFEILGWEFLPFSLIFHFLSFHALGAKIGPSQNLFVDLVSMCLRLCPEVLSCSCALDPDFEHQDLRNLTLPSSDFGQKNLLFNFFFRHGHSLNDTINKGPGFELNNTAAVLQLLKRMMLSCSELTALGLMSCRNACFDEFWIRVDAKIDLDWAAVWKFVSAVHPAPQSLLCDTLNCIIEIDDFIICSQCNLRWRGSSDGTPCEDPSYTNAKHATSNGWNMFDGTLEHDAIVSLVRVIAPRVLNFRKFTKEPVSLLRLISADFMVRSGFSRYILFRTLNERLLSSRNLAWRCMWNMSKTYNCSSDTVVDSVSFWKRAGLMHATFTDVQELLAARILVEIACTSSFKCGKYKFEDTNTFIHQIFERNKALLPLFCFHFDDFLSERQICVLMKHNSALLNEWGNHFVYVMSKSINGIQLSSSLSKPEGRQMQLLDEIVEVKRSLLGSITWSITFLNVLYMYFIEVAEEIKREKTSYARNYTMQCDSLCSMFGAFLFKCISSINPYHETDFFFHVVSRTYQALMAARPEMAAHPYLVLCELNSIQNSDANLSNFSEFNQKVINDVKHGFSSMLSEVPYMSKTEKNYETFVIVKRILFDQLVTLQEVYYDGIQGKVCDVTIYALGSMGSVLNKRILDESGGSRRKRVRSMDSTHSIEDHVNEETSVLEELESSDSSTSYSEGGSTDSNEASEDDDDQEADRDDIIMDHEIEDMDISN